MTTKYQYKIEGQLRSAKDVNFAEADFAICAFVADKEIDSAMVGMDGRYKLSFEGDPTPPTVELRLLPGKFRFPSAQCSSLVQAVSPQRFVLDTGHGATYRAVVNIPVSKQFIRNLHLETKTYRIHGDVYAQKFIIGGLTQKYSMRRLSGLRIDFYEVNQLLIPIITPLPSMKLVYPPPTERLLGSAYTDPNGSYDFKFQFTTNFITLAFLGDGKPDIKVRVSQFRDGAWRQVWDGVKNQAWESLTDWDISEDFAKDYSIPEEYVDPIPDPFPITDTVFQYTSLGLLQIDDFHIVKGYATSLPSELPFCLLSGKPFFSHQPFCGILRIFGVFATKAKQYQYYRIQVAPAVQDQVTGDWVASQDSTAWEDVTDPLNNLQWNDAKKCWDWQVLGPTPDTLVYRNIDIKPEAAWCEHTLKLTWNSANKPDGYYALRIIPCEANGDFEKDPQGNVVSRLMPVLRVDNSLPTANLQAESAGTCGNVTLGSDRKITFQVTADSPYGHILWTRLYGYRGKSGEQAGIDPGCYPLEKDRKDTSQNWDWVSPQYEEFTVDKQHPTSDLPFCSTMAYHFDLWVQGSATNGYDSELESRRVYKNVNLIISE